MLKAAVNKAQVCSQKGSDSNPSSPLSSNVTLASYLWARFAHLNKGYNINSHLIRIS